MKKLIFAAVFAACAFGMNAQLSVLKSGNVRIGIPNSYFPSTITRIVSGSIPTVTDSLASLNLLGKGKNSGGAYLTFGNLKNVGIGEFTGLPLEDSDILALYGSKGIKYMIGNKELFYYTVYDQPEIPSPFTFNCDVKASAFLKTSDARMKKDINGLSGVGEMLADIEPVSYRLTDTAPAERASATNADSEELTPMPPSDRVQYGFVAQEVREIFPELVVEDADGYLSIDYLGFIPILVDAYKNLEARVKEQDETIALLTNANVRKSPTAGVDALLADAKAVLLQNKPNPFRENTTIECVVPQGSAEAFVCVYDLQGSQVKRIDITERGNCSVSVDGSSLKPGMYVYALIIDGTEIDSKKMILTD